MAKAAFDDDAGWVEIPGFLTTTEVDEVVGQCQLLLAAEQQWPRDKVAAGTQHLESLDQRVAQVAEIVKREPLPALVTQIVGSSAELFQAGLRCPNPGYGQQSLHADSQRQDGPHPADVATAILTLTNFTSDNGATRVVPGSHRRVDLQRQSGALTSHPNEVLLTGSAGTLFVFTGHLLHSGTQNRAGQPRPALQFLWRRTGSGPVTLR